jgi:hypothetical protein
MRNVVWAVGAAVLLSGCSTDDEQEKLKVLYAHTKHYHKQLLKTEKIQLYRENETAVMLSVTYLPDAKNKRGDERFIVGYYSIDEERGGEAAMRRLTLEGSVPKAVKILKKGDVRLKEIPFVTEWNHIFLVVFPHTQKEKFDLIYEDGRYGKGVLHFAKRAKYTFVKKVF